MDSPKIALGSIAILFTENLLQLVRRSMQACSNFGKRKLSVSYIWHIYPLTNSRYKRKYPEANPCEMVWMKHFAQAIARSTIGKLDEQKATVQSVRVKVRSFTSQWQRETHQSIPEHVRKAMAPVSQLQEYLTL